MYFFHLKNKPKNMQNIKQCYGIFFFFLHHLAYGILFPQPGIKSGPQQWKYQVLTSGQPGNSNVIEFLICFLIFKLYINLQLKIQNEDQSPHYKSMF